MAAGRSALKPGYIAHSGRESEYTSGEYRTLIQELNLRQSMGRTGSCCDIAAAESLFGLLTARKELWSSNVPGGDGSFLHMGSDGNLVAYRKGGGPGIGNSYWSTATMNNPGAYLKFQNDGNLVVYKKDGGEGKGGAVWSSNTWQ